MLTPQEVQDKRFEKAMFGGYDMAVVDEFLEQLTADYGALYKENAVLKSKLKVLVETVEEYRSVDEAMRRTLYTAQKMADDLTREAKEKSEETIRRATYEAAETGRRLRAENEKELTRQQMLKEQSEHFTQRLAEAYAKQLEAINAIRTKEFPTSVPSRDEHADKATQDISTSVQAALDHGQQTADVSSSKALPPSGQAPPVQSSPVQSPSRSATHTAAHTAAHTAQFSPQPAVPPSPQLVREPQTSFEITLKGNGSNTFVSDDMEDDMASRPKFDFPDLQRQFGKQYSAQVK